MAFKIKQKDLTFAELEQTFQIKKNRSLNTLMNMEKAVTWERIEAILLEDYPKRKGYLIPNITVGSE